MLYLIYGSDRARQKEYIDSVILKNPELSILNIELDSFSQNYFEQIALGQSIFGDKYLIILDGICETKENREYIISIADELKNSANIFIIQEAKVDAEFLAYIKNFNITQENFTLAGGEIDFSLWKSFYARDKKPAWQAYLEALKSEPIEKIHAGLLGQVKNIYKVKIAPPGTTFKELGFTTEGSYGSAARGAVKYSKDELGEMLYELTNMNTLAHSGEADFGLSLEAFLLKHL